MTIQIKCDICGAICDEIKDLTYEIRIRRRNDPEEEGDYCFKDLCGGCCSVVMDRIKDL